MWPKEIRGLCELFAQVLDYPNGSLRGSAAACAQQLKACCPGASGPMETFATFVQGHKAEALEELYTQTFDVTPATTLYVGYRLFGETPKRSIFLTRLEEAYQAHSFSKGSELADHLCVLLRFLGVARNREFALPLLREGIMLTLEQVEEGLRKDKNSYRSAVHSLRLFLHQVSRALAKEEVGQHG